MNLKIKFREGFWPFAPVIPAEDATEYFDLKGDSPYMLLVAKVRDEIRTPLPADSENRPLLDRLYLERSSLPAITHIDYSARIQTVSRDTNYVRVSPLFAILKKLSAASSEPTWIFW